MALVLAVAAPWSCATAHQNRPLKAKLKPTQTTDQFSASLTETAWAPCLRRTTKSTYSATSNYATKKIHSQSGAIVSMDTLLRMG